MYIKIKETVVNTTLSALEKYGFTFDKQQSKSKIWTFSRSRDGIIDYITFDQSNHFPDSIRASIHTSKHYKAVYASEMIEENGEAGWWTFSDGETIQMVVHELLEAVIKFGIPWFERVSKSVPQIPKGIPKDLYENKEKLVEIFIEKNKYPISYVNALERIEDMIEEMYQNNTNEITDWELVLQAGAFYGEFIRKTLGASWKWIDEVEMPILDNVAGNENSIVNPLISIIRLWWNPFEKLTNRYKVLQELGRN